MDVIYRDKDVHITADRTEFEALLYGLHTARHLHESTGDLEAAEKVAEYIEELINGEVEF